MTTAEGEREGRESMILLYLLEEDLERKKLLVTLVQGCVKEAVKAKPFR